MPWSCIIFPMLCRQKTWGETPWSSSSGDEGESYECFFMWKHKISYLNIKSEMENIFLQSSPNQRISMKLTSSISSVVA